MLQKRPIALAAPLDKGAALRLRLLSILVLTPFVLVMIAIGGYAWLATILIVGILAGREFFLLLERTGYQPSMVLGLLWIELLILQGFGGPADILRPLLAALLLCSLMWSLLQDRKSAVADWALTVAGALYLGGLLSHFISLRELPDGLRWLLLPMVSVWVGDGGAYLVGMTAGRHKLWPRLSPKKTWEGTIGGFVFTIVAALAFCAACRQWAPQSAVAQMGWGHTVLLGALLGPLALAGDLVVSLFKRQAGVKDSGNLIPGHGGMLDRIDSLLLTIPLAYYWVLFVV